MKCGDCLADLGSVARFVWGTILYNPDGTTHFCDEKEDRRGK